jgi:2-dehydro-3-deoxyphosphooctonate aldolase (KDO 8-P synthase)
MSTTSHVAARPTVQIGGKTLGGGNLFLFAGPCVLETPELIHRVAGELGEIAASRGVPLVFKSSFDKANRSSMKGARGPGIEKGLELLAAVKERWKLPLVTDVHSPEQCALAAEVVDVLQIPAFLCRQTDLLQAAAETGRVVNVKKGQFLAPWDVRNIAEKLSAFKNEKFLFTERGTTFGYNNLVADMRSLFWIREAGYRVIFDATHSVQRPGGGGDTTSGDGALAPVLARAALAAGCDGLFLEVHENPARALSDGPNQIPLKHLPKHLRMFRAIHAAVS